MSSVVQPCPSAILSGKMVKSCAAVGCSNHLVKGSTLSFYHFSADTDRRLKWVAALKREKWLPTQHRWLCSAHFISGRKSDDPLSPDFVPSIYKFVTSPVTEEKELVWHNRMLKQQHLLCYS